MRLKEDFYRQSALTVAPMLLGKLLCRKTAYGVMKCRITETEAYYGEDDTACHAHKGRTKRTEVLYEQGGTVYIYLCYGIHHLLNVVCGEKNFAQAVLIRCVEGFNGPGKLTKAMNIDMSLNRTSFIDSDELWIEDDGYNAEYTTAKRVGIDYAAQEDIDKLWRFILKN